MPPAYIETAEFDCLHDDGILYADKLRRAGVEVTLNETKGTMHGFDIMQKAQITKAALAVRIEFMKKIFAKYCHVNNKISGMTDGEIRIIYVNGCIFEADGYMRGHILAPYNEKTKKLLEVEESKYDRINDDRESASVWTEAIQYA